MVTRVNTGLKTKRVEFSGQADFGGQLNDPGVKFGPVGHACGSIICPVAQRVSGEVASDICFAQLFNSLCRVGIA